MKKYDPEFKNYLDSILKLPAMDGVEYKPDISEPDSERRCRYPVSHLHPIDLSKVADPEALTQVCDWIRDPYRKRWLVLHGPSRTGKTRAACLAGIATDETGYVLESGDFFKFVRAVDFAKTVASAKGKPLALESTAFENPDYHEDDDPDDPYAGKFYYDGVIIDDLDKATFTDAVLRNFFDLFDHAEQNCRPLIITTQASGQELVNTLEGENPSPQRIALVESIIGRIIDHTHFIEFKK
ncbi:hypothetical protein P0Y35_05880 [Kiritimatiellaeota bacterium B1221]|nr:hypothetical protein [Kiritimatiellaeota bacterium B1221]